MSNLTQYPIVLDAPSYIELATDLAGAWLENTYLDPIWETDSDGNESYTVEAQDVFDYWLEQIESILHSNSIYKQGDGFTGGDL
jgi:hypothetical protein